MKKIIKWAGYPLFSVFTFLFFVYSAFPYEKLKPLLEQKIGEFTEFDVSIEEFGPNPLIGITAEQIVLRSRAKRSAPVLETDLGKDRDSVNKKSKRLQIVINELDVNFGLFSLLAGNLAVDFSLSGLGGTIEGDFSTGAKKSWELSVRAKDLTIEKIPQLEEVLSIPVRGMLSLEVDLEVPEGHWSKAEGTIKIDLSKSSVGDGNAKLKLASMANDPFMAQGVTVPKIRLGTVGGLLKIQKGELTLSDVSAKSQDVEMDLEGGIELRDPVPYSSIQAYLRFKFSEDLLKREPKFEVLTENMQRGKRSDGFYGVKFAGMLKSPVPMLSKFAPITGKRRSSRSSLGRSLRVGDSP
ncbi:MAG: type II secretion system protein GspN [Pseudomonadota bacterium]